MTSGRPMDLNRGSWFAKHGGARLRFGAVPGGPNVSSHGPTSGERKGKVPAPAKHFPASDVSDALDDLLLHARATLKQLDAMRARQASKGRAEPTSNTAGKGRPATMRGLGGVRPQFWRPSCQAHLWTGPVLPMTLMGYSIAMMILSPRRVKAVLIGTCFTELRKRLIDQATFVPLPQMLHELQVLQKRHRFQNGVSPYHHRRHRDQHPRRKLKLKVLQELLARERAIQVNHTKALRTVHRKVEQTDLIFDYNHPVSNMGVEPKIGVETPQNGWSENWPIYTMWPQHGHMLWLICVQMILCGANDELPPWETLETEYGPMKIREFGPVEAPLAVRD
eukprot:symbB.v1.2.005829.t1/scaffold343.1/size224757/6